MITVTRYHDFSAGHRVAGHESKCANLHGHNYRVHFTCGAAGLDNLGRVIDFSVIKEKLCMWLEDNWDHKFLAWVEDDYMCSIAKAVDGLLAQEPEDLYHAADLLFERSIYWTTFNPTAENMAKDLVEIVGPVQLAGTGVTLVKVVIDETRKCSATYELKRIRP